MDVRPEIRRGREPFGLIMQAIGRLKPGQDLKLVAPFRPLPLISMLAGQGFAHEAKELPNGDWEVSFTRETHQAVAPAAAAPTAPGAASGQRSTEEVEVDTRGLEPPEPMVKILEALAVLPEGTSLRAFTDRRPMHLYPELEQRGFVARTEPRADGSFVTYVTRA